MADFGVTNASVSFGSTLALDDVSVTAPCGQVTSIVGGDGAGKSTLLRVLAHRVPVTSGSVSSTDQTDLGYQPSTSGVWNDLSVLENFEFVGRSYGLTASQIRNRSADLMEQAGLSYARNRLGRNLSGGMRQKLGFLLAIMHRPTLVLLDEPSTGVDPVSRVDLWRLISATAVGGSAVLMTTTYLDEASRAASVLALDSGHTLASGTPQHVIDSVPGHIVITDVSDTSAESWRRGDVRHRWIGPEGSAGSRQPVVPDLEDATIALTLARHPSQRSATASSRIAPLPAAPATSQVVAAGHDLTRTFGNFTAVDDVSLEVAAGEIVGLIGANGAGKTTFIRSLIGLDTPTSGTVSLFGKRPGDEERSRLGYVPQGLGLYQTITVAQNVEFYSQVYGAAPAALPPDLVQHRKTTVGELGLGLQRQLAFALALAHEPELLVLDEPTSGVDPLSRARLWDTIHAQADAGRGVLVTTHYMQEAQQCSRLALLSHGRLIGTGTVQELTRGITAIAVTSPQWQQAFARLSDAGLPTTLAGRTVRIAGSDIASVRSCLGDLDATVAEVPPTLEEAMVLRETHAASTD